MHRRGLIAGAILVAVLVMGSVAPAAGEGPPAADPTAGQDTFSRTEVYVAADPTARQGTFSMTEVYFAVGLSLAAALTASISILGAGFAVGKIGAAALGSAAEHPELLTRSLLFVALAEGLAVLGFAVAMLIVMKIP